MNIRSESTTCRPYYIYGLAEPGGRIFYIGMTNDPKGRYQQHLTGDSNRRKTGMIRHVQRRIEMPILDTTTDFEQAQQLESFWILYYVLDRRYLTNTDMGAALDLVNLDDEHTEKLITMLQQRWGKEEAPRWQKEKNSERIQGWWNHMRRITTESEAWREESYDENIR